MHGDARWLALGALCALLSPTVAPAAAPPTKVTNRTQFRIPYKFDAAQLQRMQVQELRLYTTSDRGLNWLLSQTISPESGRFEFTAPEDGEYWFAVKTLDANRQLHPPAPLYEPGLIVVVDTQAPKLELSLYEVTPGRIQLTWAAEDAQLDPSTLRLEYRQPGVEQWQQVSVLPRSVGNTAWHIAQAGKVSIRASISDNAGNTGLANASLEISAPDARPEIPVLRQPVANGPASSESPLAASELANRPLDSNRSLGGGALPATAPMRPSPTVDVAGVPAIPRINPGTSRRLISESEVDRPPVAQPRWDVAAIDNPTVPNENSTANPVAPAVTAPTNPAGNGDQAAPNAPASVGLSRADQLMAVTPLGRNELPPVQTAAPVLPPQVSPQPPGGPAGSPRIAAVSQVPEKLVGQRRFQLSYAIDEVGPSGVGQVDLFITQDNGQKWWKYGQDADRRSPFDVEVPEDGHYGFALRVQSGFGLAQDPPLSGERPSMLVEVDATPPRVELSPPVQGTGPAAAQVQLRWRVTDIRPTANSVAVYTSAAPTGPWELLVAGQPLEGSHSLLLTPTMPARIYVRVAARDDAGQVGHADLAEPLMVDWRKPSARIVDVEPMGAPQ